MCFALRAFRLGIWENLLVKINQQVTKIGTSETTREAISSLNSVSSFDFLDYVNLGKPTHCNNIDPTFLEWFIGFFEGNGSICSRLRTPSGYVSVPLSKAVSHVNAKCGRVDFEIVQSITNIQVLYLIRKKLGFGRVTTFERDSRQYARWFTSKRENVLRLIYLFNGNLILEKRQKQFEQTLNLLNQFWNISIPLKLWKSQVTLKNAWLSGFSDAEAGFYTNINTGFRRGNYYEFITKFYITQFGEEMLLKQIQSLVKDTTKIQSLTNRYTPTKYNRLEICKMECIEKFIFYFMSFPLKGKRKIDFLRWARVYGYKKRKLKLSERSAKKLTRLINNLLPSEFDSQDASAAFGLSNPDESSQEWGNY